LERCRLSQYRKFIALEFPGSASVSLYAASLLRSKDLGAPASRWPHSAMPKIPVAINLFTAISDLINLSAAEDGGAPNKKAHPVRYTLCYGRNLFLAGWLSASPAIWPVRSEIFMMRKSTKVSEHPAHQALADASLPDRHGSMPLDRLTALSMLYLGLPLFMFFAGWLRIPFALAFLLMLIYGYVVLWGNCHAGAIPFRFKWIQLIFLGVAIIWTCFGGAGHIFYANRFDWSLRDAVLRDLTVAAWPPGYDIGGTVNWILRCPLGYFLPAALAGKVLGLSVADSLLWIWTAIGIWIFLLLLPIDTRRLTKIGDATVIVVLFSGMDALGWWVARHANPPMYQHLEWWAILFQYSSNTTLLFWTPNHALPGWIAAALFWRHWKTDGFISISPLLLAIMPLWSPFPMIGMLPFYFLLLFRVMRERKWQKINWPLLSISILVIAAITAFLSADIGGVPGGSNLNRTDLSVFLIVYGFFVLFEFGILSAVLWISNSNPIVAISAVVLLSLPFIQFGPNNDLAMRASIPALVFLCIATIDACQHFEKMSRIAFAIFCIVLILGAITPVHEFYRALTVPSWKADYEVNVMSYGSAPPAHYVAKVEYGWRTWIFRDICGITRTNMSNQQPKLSKEELP
jgi:hypothetical protein